MVDREDALPGRTDQTMPVPAAHHVNGNPLAGPWPDGFETAIFGLGCFWGAERKFWQTPGVHSTAVGYAGGFTPNPTYEETCSGRTGHAEVVLVVFDPSVVSYEALLKVFWENHDPTQGMRQGNDMGSAVPQRDLHDHGRAADGRAGQQGAVPGALKATPATARSPPRSRLPATSTTPSRTTSSTSPRTRWATAASAAPASAAPSASPPDHPPQRGVSGRDPVPSRLLGATQSRTPGLSCAQFDGRDWRVPIEDFRGPLSAGCSRSGARPRLRARGELPPREVDDDVAGGGDVGVTQIGRTRTGHG